MKMKFLGTGTSHGVPVIGCSCSVCKSVDPRDNRMRSSAYIFDPVNVVIDTGPEFRIQAIRAGITKLDSVFYTHNHADHLHGLDDLRIFSHTQSGGVDASGKPKADETEGPGIDIHANPSTIKTIRQAFNYIFCQTQLGGGKPKLHLVSNDLYTKENPIEVGSVKAIPVPLKHGSLDDSGYVFYEERDGVRHSIVYLTDCNFIPEESFELIKEAAGTIEHLIIDGLRVKPHPTHFCFDESMKAADRIGARCTWITHVTHNLSHIATQEYLDTHVMNYPTLFETVKKGGVLGVAYDGLVIEA